MHTRRRRRPDLESLEARLCLSTSSLSGGTITLDGVAGIDPPVYAASIGGPEEPPPKFPGTPFPLNQSNQWTQTPFQGSPIFADLNNDGRDELITPVAGSALLAFTAKPDGSGYQLYQLYAAGAQANFKSTPLVVDLPNGRKGIFAALGRDESRPGAVEDARVFGWYADNGQIIPGWPVSTLPSGARFTQSGVTGSLAAGDLDGDHVPEIVVNSFNHFVTAFHLDGSIYWRFLNDETVEAGSVIGDIDRDGRNEVVFTSGMSPNVLFPGGGLVNILNGDGTARYRIHVGEVFFAAPILADLTGDGNLEIIAAPGPYFATIDPSLRPMSKADALKAGDRIYAFNYKGELLPGWPYHTSPDDATNHQVWKEMAAADIDGNGTIEVIALDAGGFNTSDNNAPDPRLHVVQPNGQALPGWENGLPVRLPTTPQQSTLLVQQTSFTSPIVADVNGDGDPDIVVGYGAYLLAFDKTGKRLFADAVIPQGSNIPDGHWNAAAVGQFDGVGGLEMATVTANATPPGRPDLVSIYKLPESTLRPPWPMLRRDAGGDAVQRSLPFLRDYVQDVSRAVRGTTLPTNLENLFVEALATNQYGLYDFARAQAQGPGALNHTINTIYQRFLDRAPSQGELQQWRDRLRTDRSIDLERTLALSSEFTSTGSLRDRVDRLYRAAFPRVPTAQQLDAWTNVVQKGYLTYPQLVDTFLVTDLAVVRRFFPVFNALGKSFPPDSITAIGDAFRNQNARDTDIAGDILASGGNYGATHTTTRWVRTIYRDILGREANPYEVAYRVRQLETGQVNPSSLVQALLYSPEGRASYVREQYHRFLHRDPTPAEVNFLKNYAKREDVIVYLASGDEYFRINGNTNAGFIAAAYHDIAYFNKQNFPQSIINTWTAQFNSGAPRSTLIVALLNSEKVAEQVFKYLPDESLGGLRVGYFPYDSQPVNPDPDFLAYLTNVVNNGERLEDAITILMTTPKYFADAAYWKGYYINRAWRGVRIPVS